MAYFAKLDSNNNVLGLHTVSEADCTDDNGRSEAKGITYLSKVHKWPYWKEYKTDGVSGADSSIRKRGAQIGGTYSTEHDAFIPPKPYPSWNFNVSSLNWDPPVVKPAGPHDWDEDAQAWVVAVAPGAQ
jgi:hypothetical protein|tara:strand:- start:7157 stop:7543 length:387 start_codon:yes stop_codon:yes gene_type:complete